MSCSPAGLDCAYSQGQCNCTYTSPVIFLDGGLGGPVWKCYTPTGCPEPRPRIGDACTGTQTCDYGACYGGVAVQCSGSYWKQAFVPCPG